MTRERDSDAAVKLLEEWISAEHSLVAPSLMRIEVANALLIYTRRGLMPKEKCLEALDRLEELPLQYRLEDWTIIRNAQQLAAEIDVAVYDAVYLALAQTLNATFATADEKLARKAKGRVTIRLL